jgi:AcrR family transcriptional regulator
MSPDEEIKQSIINVAADLLNRYGYQKTTMADVAKGAHMSPANLYRHFTSKIDMMAAVIVDGMEQSLVPLEAIVTNESLPPAAKLEQLLLTQLGMVHYAAIHFPNASEAVKEVARERQEIVISHGMRYARLIEKIITQGVATGDFAVTGPVDTAVQFVFMTYRYTTPENVLMSGEPSERLQELAKESVRIFIAGISAR